MFPNIESMQPVAVLDEDSFLHFVIEQSPTDSLWVILEGHFSSEEETALRQFDNTSKIQKTSQFEITLSSSVKPLLLAQLLDLTFPVHHMIYDQDEAFMVSYDSFSACWISRKVPKQKIERLMEANVIEASQDNL